MAAQIQVTAPERKITRYEKFRGVDFTTDELAIDRSRSPWAPNMIADQGGNPEKRVGWRVLWDLGARINGMHAGLVNMAYVVLIHAGTSLYSWNMEGQPALIASGLRDDKSAGFAMGGKIWLLDGERFRAYGIFEEGSAAELKDVAEIAYVPTTTIARMPSGGGSVFDEVNLLTPKRQNWFTGDGSSTEFQLDASPIDDASVGIRIGEETELTEGTDFTVDREAGKITFTAAPALPEVVGQDNVFVTFSKTNPEYYGRIGKCQFGILYGIGSNDRIFVSGNPDTPAQDWHSQINDPTYFPDLNYALVGSDSTAIVGYLRVSGQIAIVKEDKALDSTVFLRTAQLSSDGKTPLFPMQQGITGIGAISRTAFAYLGDEPLFLSRRGVYGITSTLIIAERTVANRSFFVDPRLTREAGQAEAVACEWNGIYLLVYPSGNAYILDGRQNKSYKPNSNGEYVYECYHWDSIPARVFHTYKNDCFFGTADGRLCRFNNDMPDVDRFNDVGNAIKCSWSTLADVDGFAGKLKTMTKRGSVVVIKPYRKSSVAIYVRTDKDEGRLIRRENMDIFDWSLIDFERFTFDSTDSPKTVAFNRKVKKYIWAQIICENVELNEGFGIFRIEKSFRMGANVK
ncbi:MAG: DUF2460 domain-containing protein [Christensenellaceae bacterium]|jgi:hypothetical protein|nr:DUF2460 domain-containing protein [Christensenellaceae bacterium]